MKKLLSLLALLSLSLGFSSCCSMFGTKAKVAGYITETRTVATGEFEIVSEEVFVADPSGKGGMTQTVQKKVPRYETITYQARVPCPDCTRYYCPEKDCCGTSSEAFLKMATAQGPTGSPHIGLVPTMKVLAP